MRLSPFDNGSKFALGSQIEVKKAYLGPYQISMMEFFGENIYNGSKLLTVLTQSPSIDLFSIGS